jgi:hypothetical protein
VHARVDAVDLTRISGHIEEDGQHGSIGRSELHEALEPMLDHQTSLALPRPSANPPTAWNPVKGMIGVHAIA